MATHKPAAALRWRTYKCCTFQPFLANFLCGAALEAGLSPLEILSDRAILQPIGILPTLKYRKLHARVQEDDREHESICSYYDKVTRECQIWSHRPGECSLYYCARDRNEEALSTKRQDWALKSLNVEANLAQMALAYLGFSPRQIAEQVQWINDPPVNSTALKATEARDLYHSSWRWLNEQDPLEVQGWLGFDNALVRE